jgi:hypothetical protein
MDKKLQAMLASYGRSFLAAVTTAFMITGGDLLALDGDSLKAILAAGLAAVLPVAIRAANPKDPAFGKIADGVTEAVVGKLTKKAPAKKATAEK